MMPMKSESIMQAADAHCHQTLAQRFAKLFAKNAPFFRNSLELPGNRRKKIYRP
jgi:hypothetical protein